MGKLLEQMKRTGAYGRWHIRDQIKQSQFNLLRARPREAQVPQYQFSRVHCEYMLMGVFVKPHARKGAE